MYTVRSVEDSTVCNDEKLVSGSTAAYVTSARHFFKSTIFQDDQPWPNVIWAPSNMVDSDEAPNVQISVSKNTCSFLMNVLTGMTAPRATSCRVRCLRFPHDLLAEESRFEKFHSQLLHYDTRDIACNNDVQCPRLHVKRVVLFFACGIAVCTHDANTVLRCCLLYTSPSPRDRG